MDYKHNIAIMGLSTSFNVETARVVADELELHFMDVNRYLEFSGAYKISQIVQDLGVDYFLKCEKKIYKELQSYTGSIFGVSMTALLDKENILNLKKNSYIVLLKTTNHITNRRFNQDYDNYIKDYVLQVYGDNLSRVYQDIEEMCDIVLLTNKLTPVQTAQKVKQGMAKLILEEE